MKRRSKTINCKRRRSSSECSSEKQKEMAEDVDEPQDFKILKEEPDKSDKTCEMSGGGLNRFSEEKTLNPSSSQVSLLPGTSNSSSYDDRKKYQASFNPRANRRKEERNQDSQQQSKSVGYEPDLLYYIPLFNTRVYDCRKSAGPGPRLLHSTEYIPFSLNKASDSTDLHSRNPISSSAIDWTSSPAVICNEPSAKSELCSAIERHRSWTPDSHVLKSLRVPEPVSLSRKLHTPEGFYQLPDEKTVNPASSSSQVSSLLDSSCYSSETETGLKPSKSSQPSLRAENSRTQSGIQFYYLHSPSSTYRDCPRVYPRTSPSGIDKLNHPDLCYQSGMNTEPEPQSGSLTGVGQERNKDSEQLGGGYLSWSDLFSYSSSSPSLTPFAFYESAGPASRSSPSTDSIPFSFKKASDSTDLHSRNQTSSSADLTLFSKSSSRDRLHIDAAEFDGAVYQIDDIELPVMSELCSLTEPLVTHDWSWTPDPSERRRKLSCLSHSSSSLNQIISTGNTNLKRAASLPNMKLQGSFEEFTPDFTDDEEEESYRFQCSGPGLYQCRETGLVFDMEAEGDVFYRIVPWNRRSLSQYHKKPAGPLFDISCEQQSVCRLHLPHCETPSTGRCHFLSVAHIDDEGMEFIRPAKISETHVIINITGFSAFGNVKDEDSPPDPVRALVLLFYKPPVDPDPEYQINVLMLPKNVVVREVLRFRKQLDGDEMFLETPPHCKLLPKQVYTLSTGPEDDSVLVQPTEAEFDEESYDNYFTAFQVTYEKLMKHIKLFLKDSSSSSVWERRVCLSSSGVKRSCGSTCQNLCPKDLLAEIRISFIDGISEPVLKYLLDELLQKNVIHDAEKEAILVKEGRGDKARSVIDTVRRKGDSASSEMIKCLCKLDPFLCKHLGLK